MQLSGAAGPGALGRVRPVLFQRHPDAGQQFLDGEGLGHVVVRAHVQPHDLVAHVILGGEHDDGHVALLAQAAADFDAAQFRQHQVQNQKIGLPVQAALQAGAAVIGALHLVALVFQFQCDEARDLGFVLHDQYLAQSKRPFPLWPVPYYRISASW